MGLDPAEVGKRPRQGFGEIEQRIGARTECAERQPSRHLAAQAGDYSSLKQGRLTGAGCAQNHKRLPLSGGTHLPQRFQYLRDFATAAIEQRGIGVIVAERGETRERRGT
jgi:hypothetical protein